MHLVKIKRIPVINHTVTKVKNTKEDV